MWKTYLCLLKEMNNNHLFSHERNNVFLALYLSHDKIVTISCDCVNSFKNRYQL